MKHKNSKHSSVAASERQSSGTDGNATAPEHGVGHLADDIVALVERTNGPVLLSDLDKKVPGFHQAHGPAYSYFASNGKDELVIWDEMTEAGYKALRMVLEERRVAMQPVNVPFCLAHGARIAEGTGLPCVLLPVRAANLDTPNGVMRVSSSMQQMLLMEAARCGNQLYRALDPREVRLTADQFSF